MSNNQNTTLIPESDNSFLGTQSLSNRMRTLEKAKAGCVYDLETNISYADGGSNYNYLGASPNWIKTYDQYDDFDQSIQIFNCSQKGCYMVTYTIMPDSIVNKYIQVYIELMAEDKTTIEREYVLEYSTNAYHRNGQTITPPMRKGQGIRIRIVPIGSGNTVFRGITSGTGAPRVHNHFSIMQLDDAE